MTSMAHRANRAGSRTGVRWRRLAPSTQAHMEQKLASVALRRSHAPSADEIARLLAEMQSPDEQVRSQAVRQVCPCRVPWEVFYQVRSAAKRLQHDSSPLVRANAWHVEEDAQELASLEALQDWTVEHDEGVRAIAHRLEQRGSGRRLSRRPHRQWQAGIGRRTSRWVRGMELG